MICSYFLGICFSTSIFSRRNKNGRNTYKQITGLNSYVQTQQSVTWKSQCTHKYSENYQYIITWCSLFTIDSEYSWLPSTIPVKGLENHSRKSECEEKTVGIRKCISDHNSINEFCSGVPVSNSLRWLLKFSNVCHRWLLKFLIFWAYYKQRIIIYQHCVFE